jgi:hypothetical protein
MLQQKEITFIKNKFLTIFQSYPAQMCHLGTNGLKAVQTGTYKAEVRAGSRAETLKVG